MTTIRITGKARRMREALAAKNRRKEAYVLEADPLFFKWQAGEVKREEWLLKRAEIRSRYPLPEDNI